MPAAQNEHDLKYRLTRLRAQLHGDQMVLVLRRLSLFLNERFGWVAIKAFTPLSDKGWPFHFTTVLAGQKFIHRTIRTSSYEYYRRSESLWTISNYYWVDAEIVQRFCPAPSSEERLFATHAGPIFRGNRGIPQHMLDTYLHLIGWTQDHHPDIALAFAMQVASRYGGADMRPHETAYALARSFRQTDQQALIMWKLSKIAFRAHNMPLATARCQQVLTLGDPQSNLDVVDIHMGALNMLIRIAHASRKTDQVRILSEWMLALSTQRERISQSMML